MGKNRGTKVGIKFIAIAGPTASGKSFLAESLTKTIGKKKCLIIPQDNYYKDWSNLNINERKKINFDDIHSFDFALFYRDLNLLKENKFIVMPKYNFIKSARLRIKTKVWPKEFIIVEGLMPFIKNGLSKLFDFKIYLDTPNYICLSRRIKRDNRKRGDTINAVCYRYFNDVLPMQKVYVEPQKRFADMVIDGSLSIDSIVEKECLKIISKIKGKIDG